MGIRAGSPVYITSLCSLLCCSLAQADTVGYVANPTANSIDFGAGVTALGGVMNTSVNFDTHPTGTLVGNFYTASQGVTLTPFGDVDTVLFGPGPDGGDKSSKPLSAGEGIHDPSNYLLDMGEASSLTISFNSPVLAAGLFVVDYFNPFGTSPLTITAYSGPNGTGANLGTFSSVAFNFQANSKYFMGVTRSEGDIGSLVFHQVNPGLDQIGLDDIRFARAAAHAPVPAAVWGGLALLGGLALSQQRKRLGIRN